MRWFSSWSTGALSARMLRDAKSIASLLTWFNENEYEIGEACSTSGRDETYVKIYYPNPKGNRPVRRPRNGWKFTLLFSRTALSSHLSKNCSKNTHSVLILSSSYKVLLRVNEQRNILHEIRKRKANWIGHVLRRNCLLQRVIEGKIQGGIEVTGRQGRRRKKLLDDLKERRGYSHLKEEALDRTIWRARFGRGFGPVVRQTTEWMSS